MSAQRTRFAREHDPFRSLVVDEPRGSSIVVGALLRPGSRRAISGVIFFNNVGYLGMCGHGTIGVLVTLRHLDRVREGAEYRLETPVGEVRAVLHSRHEVTFENVESYPFRQNVPLDVPGFGRVVGDVAWGGNWFFLVDDSPVPIGKENVSSLTEYTWAVRRALQAARVTGADGAEIDHIELSGPARRADANSRNFVLCPGGEFDRSPCGTGTSAKMASLHAKGLLRAGDVWRQEGILGTVFEGRFSVTKTGIVPSIRGSAYITGEGDLWVDSDDPLSPKETS